MQNKTIGLLLLSMALTGCKDGGNGDKNSNDVISAENVVTAEQYSQYIDQRINSMSAISQLIEPPQEVDSSLDDATVSGIDSNNNGVRDNVEVGLYQALYLLPDITKEQYEQVLSLVQYVEPQDPPIAESIEEQTVYCMHSALPSEVKGELPLSQVYTIVLDTQERVDAFNASSVPVVANLGAEVCS